MKSKAQLFSFDFVFSMVIIVSVFVLLSSVWTSLQQTVSSGEVLKQNQETALSSIDFILMSHGYPENWENAANVSEIYGLGLKGSEGLSLAKTLALIRIAGGNYSETLFLFGLTPLNFRLWISENFSSGKPALSGVARFPVAYFASDSRDFFEVLDGQNETWDYYWGLGNLPQPDWGNSRTQYAGSLNDALQKLLENQTNYKSIVIEAPEMLASDVNATLLQKFLDEGGTLIYIGGNSETEIAISSFGSFFHNDTGNTGVVTQKGFLLKDVQAGTNVSSSSKWLAVKTNDSVQVFVENSENESQALVAEWNYGLGRIYFISDFAMDFGGTAGKEVFNIAGWPLDYGIAQPSTAKFVFPISRFSFIEADRRIPVSVNLVAWSDYG